MLSNLNKCLSALKFVFDIDVLLSLKCGGGISSEFLLLSHALSRYVFYQNFYGMEIAIYNLYGIKRYLFFY